MNGHTGEPTFEYTPNKLPEWVGGVTITEFESGDFLLSWWPKRDRYGGETGFFLSLRAAKMYIASKAIGAGVKYLKKPIEPTD